MLTAIGERRCGDCTFCCKVMAIDELSKPVGVWCRHRSADGCSVYGDHPPSCKSFVCQWLMEPSFPTSFRPDKVKVVLTTDDDGPRLIANCDPNTPLTWRREPMYSFLKEQAARTWSSPMTVMAKAGSRLGLLTPTQEIDIGAVHDRSPLTVEKRNDGSAKVTVLPPIASDEDVATHLSRLRKKT